MVQALQLFVCQARHRRKSQEPRKVADIGHRFAAMLDGERGWAGVAVCACETRANPLGPARTPEEERVIPIQVFPGLA